MKSKLDFVESCVRCVSRHPPQWLTASRDAPGSSASSRVSGRRGRFLGAAGARTEPSCPPRLARAGGAFRADSVRLRVFYVVRGAPRWGGRPPPGGEPAATHPARAVGTPPHLRASESCFYAGCCHAPINPQHGGQGCRTRA